MQVCTEGYTLCIVGDEPTQEFVEMKNNMKLDNVVFVGFKTKEELKDYYIAADVFCLQTRGDVWGLVVNEAMHTDCPLSQQINVSLEWNLLKMTKMVM